MFFGSGKTCSSVICSATVERIIVFHRVIEGHAPMSVIAASEELEQVIAVEACRILDQIVKIKESGSRIQLDKANPFRFQVSP